LLGLSALGLRPAVDDLRPAVPVGEGQAQHPRRHRRALVQAAAAQREAEREPAEVRQSRRLSGIHIGAKPDRLPVRSGRRLVFYDGWVGGGMRSSSQRRPATMTMSGTIWITPSAATAP